MRWNHIDVDVSVCLSLSLIVCVCIVCVRNYREWVKCWMIGRDTLCDVILWLIYIDVEFFFLQKLLNQIIYFNPWEYNFASIDVHVCGNSRCKLLTNSWKSSRWKIQTNQSTSTTYKWTENQIFFCQHQQPIWNCALTKNLELNYQLSVRMCMCMCVSSIIWHAIECDRCKRSMSQPTNNKFKENMWIIKCWTVNFSNMNHTHCM